MYNLPGEDPMAELGELLGGAPDEHMARLDKRLALVELEDRTGLPNQYVLDRLGGGPKLIRGSCAVVRMSREGRLGDVTVADAERAQEYISPLGSPESREADFWGEEAQGNGAEVRRSRTEQSGLCADEEVQV